MVNDQHQLNQSSAQQQQQKQQQQQNDDVLDDHCSQEIINLMKETLNYQTGAHHTFVIFGASVNFSLFFRQFSPFLLLLFLLL